MVRMVQNLRTGHVHFVISSLNNVRTACNKDLPKFYQEIESIGSRSWLCSFCKNWDRKYDKNKKLFEASK